MHAARRSELPKEPGIQRAPKLFPPGPRGGPGLRGKPLGMCTQPQAARDQGWGTFSRPASWSFLHQLQGQRERRVPRPWLHSALTVLLRPAWSWEMLSKTCSPSALGWLLFPPSAVTASWQHRQLLPPPAAKRQPAGQCTAPGQHPPHPLRSSCQPGVQQTHWGQEDKEPWPPAHHAGPLARPAAGGAGWGWRGLHVVSAQECALGEC